MGESGARSVPCDPTVKDLAGMAGRNGPDMLVVLDPSWQVRYANEAAERTLGVSVRDAPADLLHWIHPADAPSVLSALEALRDTLRSHAPVQVRVRCGDDGWLGCDVATSSVQGPGGIWTVLSVRKVAERDELADRQATLSRLIHFSAVEFARTRWYEVDEVTRHLLRSLCRVFGASLVEIAWSETADGSLTLGACWSTQSEDGWNPDRLCDPGAPFEEIRGPEQSTGRGAWSCEDLTELEEADGIKRYLDAGLDSVVELGLSPDRPRAVLRMGFADGLGTWDEINTEPVSLLGLLVLSSLRRCRLEEELNERARRDSLTGVLNRGEFYQDLEVCVSSPHQVGRVGVLYCDIDSFKSTNDSFGHAAGDQVLRVVAGAIRDSVREGDQVARVGGDEFVALCRGLDSPEQLDVVKNRVAQRLAEVDVPGGSVGLTIGTAVLENGQDADALLSRADAAMYRTKRERESDGVGGRGSRQVRDRVVEDAEQRGA